EDDDDDADLIRLRLLKDNFPAEITRAENRNGFINALHHQSFDLILADYRLRAFNGLEALKITLEHSPETPFIFVSGMLGEEPAIDSLKEGATDYVLKNQLVRLIPALRRAMRESRERKARKKADEQFRAFSRLGQRLSSVATPTDAARIIVEAADALIGWDSCSLNLYSPEQNVMHTVLKMDVVEGARASVPPVPAGMAPSPLMKRIMDQGGQLILREGPPRLSSELTPFGDTTRASASLMFVPIHNGAKAVGILSIQSYQSGAYSPEDLDILQALAGHCGGALERIRSEEALSRLAAIVESSSDAIIGTTLEGVITSWNSGAEKIFGYTPDEAKGRSISMLLPPDRSREESQTLDRIKRGGRAEPFDTVCVRKDGRLIDVSSTSSPIKDATGNIVGASKIAHDITERKQVEAALQKIEDLYRRAISGVGAVPYLYDYATKSYGFMGGGIATLIGYTPQEMSPGLWHQLTKYSVMLGETAGLTKEEAAQRMLSGKIRYWRCDSLITTRSGELRWISDVSLQSLDGSGKPVGSIGILQDITERKQAESHFAAISKLGRGLSSASNPKEVALIIGNIAHELFGWDAFALDLFSSEGDKIQTRLKLDAVNRQQPDVEIINLDNPPDAMAQQFIKAAGASARALPEKVVPGGSSFPSASVMCVDIKHKNQVIGILSLRSDAQDAYNAKDLAALQTLADYCAGALERMRVEEKVTVLSTQLLNAARRAGMEEVANNVLHNVGNVLNSVNVSATLVTDNLSNSKLAGLSRAAELLRSRAQDLDSFIAEDPQGQKLPDYLE
ncbi:MAG TPA: PAS domain S-box protein, partial [Verrucomicrobiae bacterium]|nr:PAS domain S-box protein [Verrucomicrobiae bacterium]